MLIDNRTDNGGLLVAAVLQGQRRATVVGELKSNVNGAVSSSEIHVDVPVPANDEGALLTAARDLLARQRQP